MDSTKIRTQSLSLRPEEQENLRDLARQDHRTVTAEVRWLVEQEVARRNGNA